MHSLKGYSINFPVLNSNASGKKIPCTTAAFNLQGRIYHGTDLQNNSLVTFLDIYKAFDIVWHEALLFKLHKIRNKWENMAFPKAVVFDFFIV